MELKELVKKEEGGGKNSEEMEERVKNWMRENLKEKGSVSTPFTIS